MEPLPDGRGSRTGEKPCLEQSSSTSDPAQSQNVPNHLQPDSSSSHTGKGSQIAKSNSATDPSQPQDVRKSLLPDISGPRNKEKPHVTQSNSAQSLPKRDQLPIIPGRQNEQKVQLGRSNSTANLTSNQNTSTQAQRELFSSPTATSPVKGQVGKHLGKPPSTTQLVRTGPPEKDTRTYGQLA